jgi:hypothetical protein
VSSPVSESPSKLSRVGAQGVLEPANFWMWWAGPGLLYLMERVTRGVRKNQDTIILQAIAHKSQVLELRMRKANLQWRVSCDKTSYC